MIESETDIANMALDMLDEAPIVNINTDERKVAKAALRQYSKVRDEELRRHTWQFARKRASLAASATAPAFEWLRAFPLPDDCLRLMPITADGAKEGRKLRYEVEQNMVLTDEEAPLKIRYIARITDVTKFDPLFARALAGRLAMNIGHPITHKTSYMEKVRENYHDAIVDAQIVDQLEGSHPRALDTEWEDERVL